MSTLMSSTWIRKFLEKHIFALFVEISNLRSLISRLGSLTGVGFPYSANDAGLACLSVMRTHSELPAEMTSNVKT